MTSTRLLTPAALLGALALTGLTLTGCSTEPGPAPDATPAPSEVEVAPEPTAAECLIGTWRSDNASYEQFLSAVGAPMTVSGAEFWRFDEAGAYFNWREDFGYTTGSGVAAVTHVSNSSWTGEYGTVLDWRDSGTDYLWVAETLTVVHDEVLTVAGIAQVIDQGSHEMTVIFQGYPAEVPVVEGREQLEGSGPFRCDAGTLRLEVDLGTEMVLHRVG